MLAWGMIRQKPVLWTPDLQWIGLVVTLNFYSSFVKLLQDKFVMDWACDVFYFLIKIIWSHCVKHLEM